MIQTGSELAHLYYYVVRYSAQLSPLLAYAGEPQPPSMARPKHSHRQMLSLRSGGGRVSQQGQPHVVGKHHGGHFQCLQEAMAAKLAALPLCAA